MKIRKCATVLSAAAAAAVLVSTASAYIYSVHSGSRCAVYDTGRLVFEHICLPGQTAICTITVTEAGSWVFEGCCEGNPTPNPD